MVKDAKKEQPEVNIGMIGHVDHGKTTLLQALSGKWADQHSEEMKRGITIKLGYADVMIYKCKKCKEPECYSIKPDCSVCKKKSELIRKISFVDAPGHETLMATMLSGAAIMDGALLLVAANEECPQPQTKEHLIALEIAGIKNVIVVQNKIDLVTEEDAMKNQEQIKAFLKGTFAENAPIIPISAQNNVNIDLLLKTIQEVIPTPKRDLKAEPLMYIARSFDVNKPGSEIEKLVGGILGGALKRGLIKVGEKIEIRPGVKKEKEGKVFWEPIVTKIISLKTGGTDVKEVGPGGSIGILTDLDPAIVKADTLSGNIAGLEGKLPEIIYNLDLKVKLLERVVGSKKETEVDPIKKGEVLMINVGSTATVGVVTEISKDSVKIILKKPVCATKEDNFAVSRRIENRFRLIGQAKLN
ncbi:translation initiation factor IF-2 subunit gamma [Candidatus Woesearchaeota archaeon]|nr:translation initiation factor IF-2 subunit gamma [Candidatus Woesearchaeota archaeon]